MCRTHVVHVCSRSKSQLKVKYQTIKYKTWGHVRSVSPTQVERVSLILAQMFTSARECAEPILPFCRLKSRSHFKLKYCLRKYCYILTCFFKYFWNLKTIFAWDFIYIYIYIYIYICKTKWCRILWRFFIYIKTCLMYKYYLKKQFLNKPQPVALKNLQGVKFIWKRRQYDVNIVMTSWRHLGCMQLLSSGWNMLIKCSSFIYIYIYIYIYNIIWSVTSMICRSSFITLYCILTSICPFYVFKFSFNQILDNMSCPLY